MMLDITVCRHPDRDQFERLLREKLPSLCPALAEAPQTVFHTETSLCFHVTTDRGYSELLAADTVSGESALLVALQCIEARSLSSDLHIVLLSPDPPPALPWLDRQGHVRWLRCEVLSINGSPGLLIDPSPDAPSVQTASPSHVTATPPPREVQRASIHPVASPRDAEVTLTEEENRFFSHL